MNFNQVLMLVGLVLALLGLLFEEKPAARRNKLIAGILALLVGFVLDQKKEWDAAAHARRTALTGHLKPETRREARTRVTFLFGTDTLEFLGGHFIDGTEVSVDRFLGVDQPLSFKLTPRGILVSGKFNDLDGKLVAELVDNEWTVTPTNKWDRNYDHFALEVRDEHGTAVLQVKMLDQVTLRVGGVLGAGEQIAVVSDSGMMGMERPTNPDESRQLRALADEHIRLWFKYPSASHLGQLAH